MIIKDYENLDKFNELEKYYISQLKSIANLNTNNYLTNINEIINKGLEKEANLSKEGCIYNILCGYAIKYITKKQLSKPQKYHIPYINYAILNKKTKLIHTDKNEIHFKLIVDSFPQLLSKIITNGKQFFPLYRDLYLGKTNGKCHQICLFYPIDNYNIVTAYLPHIFTPLKFLHTYQENDNLIIDLSHNLIFDKKSFYSLLNPEIVSIIKTDNWINDFKNKKVHGDIKNYLVNYPKQNKM